MDHQDRLLTSSHRCMSVKPVARTPAAGAKLRAMPRAKRPAPPAEAQALTDQRGAPEGLDAGLNASILARIDVCIATILDFPFFEGIQAAEPLSVSSGGSKSPFNATDFSKAINTTGFYEAGCNFWWQDIRRLAQPGVPMREKSIMDVKDHLFTAPPPFGYPGIVTVAVLNKGADIGRSTMLRVSPEEPIFAFIIGLAESLDRGCSEADLLAWKRAMLTVQWPQQQAERCVGQWPMSQRLRFRFVVSERGQSLASRFNCSMILVFQSGIRVGSRS